MEPFAIFDFTPITGAIVLAGILFMVLFGRMLLPVRSSGSLAAGASAGTPYEMEAHLFTTTIPIHSPLIGCTLAESRLGSALYLSVVAIQRNGQMILSPGPAERLQVHDTLIVHGQPEHLRRFHGSHHLQVASMEELGDRVDQCLQMIEGQVHKGSSLEGKTLAEIGLRREYQVHVLTLVAENQNRITDVRGHRLEAGDRLVLQGSGPVLNQISELGFLERIKSVSPDDAAALAGEGKHLMCVGVPEGSVLADRDLVEGRMGHAFGLTVVGILRGEEWVCVPSPHEKIVAGDLLLLQGSVKDLEVLEGLQDLEVNAQSKGLMAELESQQIGITEVLLSPRTTLVGRTLSDLRFREHYGVSVLALWRKGRPRRTGLQDMPLKFGDALLVYGQRQSLEAVAKDPDFLVLDQSATQAPALQKAPIAIFIMLSVLVSAISGLVPISIAAVTGASLMVLAGCLSIEAAYRAIDWRVVFLTASMLPLGMAVQKTGVAPDCGPKSHRHGGGHGAQVDCCGTFHCHCSWNPGDSHGSAGGAHGAGGPEYGVHPGDITASLDDDHCHFGICKLCQPGVSSGPPAGNGSRRISIHGLCESGGAGHHYRAVGVRVAAPGFLAGLIRFPNQGILKKSYLAQSLSVRREKNLSAFASLRDEKYFGHEFFIGATSCKTAVKSFHITHSNLI